MCTLLHAAFLPLMCLHMFPAPLWSQGHHLMLALDEPKRAQAALRYLMYITGDFRVMQPSSEEGEQPLFIHPRRARHGHPPAQGVRQRGP